MRRPEQKLWKIKQRAGYIHRYLVRYATSVKSEVTRLADYLSGVDNIQVEQADCKSGRTSTLYIHTKFNLSRLTSIVEAYPKFK